MATEAAQREQTTDEDTDQEGTDQQSAQPQAQQSEGTEATAQAESGNEGQNQAGEQDTGNNAGRQDSNGRSSAPQSQRRSQKPTYYYDPQAAARTGLLQLAVRWKEAGAPNQAMYTFMEILNRYPQTGTAAAATEELVDLARQLENQGMFYAALSIYQKLEAAL